MKCFFSQACNHFPEATLIGCLFHFKQALRRKMIKLGIPEEEVKFVMQKGVIDLITVIPVEHLNPKGTAFVAAKIYDYCAELYGKGSDEYKESEKRWMTFGLIILCRKFHSLGFLIRQSFPNRYFDVHFAKHKFHRQLLHKHDC